MSTCTSINGLSMMNEIKKSMYLPLYIMAVILICLVCMTSVGYTTPEGKSYSILSFLMSGWTMEGDIPIGLNRWSVWDAGIYGGWFFFLTPVLGTLGFSYVYASERDYKVRTFIFTRETIRRYALKKTVALAVTSGITLLSGYVLFCLITGWYFPGLSYFSQDEAKSYMQMSMQAGCGRFILEHVLGMFLFGVAMGGGAGCIMVLFRDRYFSYSMPVLLNYIYSNVLQKIEIETTDDQVYYMTDLLKPSGLLQLQGITVRDLLVRLTMIVAVYIVFYVLQVSCIKHQEDMSE